MYRSRIVSLLIPAGLVATLAACADSAGPNAQRVSLSFATDPAAGASARPSLSVSASANGDVIEITRAQIVLREIELTAADTAACPIEDGEAECQELEVGPLLVDLPLNGNLASPLTVMVPAGSYREVELELHKAEDGDEADDTADRAFLAAHPEFRGLSVRVEGTYNGQPFVFTSNVMTEMELEFATPLVIDAATNNITVHVDVAGWFRSATGGLLAPTAANESEIAQNIKASFEVFEDDDRDGDDDSN